MAPSLALISSLKWMTSHHGALAFVMKTHPSGLKIQLALVILSGSALVFLLAGVACPRSTVADEVALPHRPGPGLAVTVTLAHGARQFGHRRPQHFVVLSVQHMQSVGYLGQSATLGGHRQAMSMTALLK